MCAHAAKLQGGGGTYVGIPLDGFLGHALGSDMVDQLGSNAREHILKSLSGHGWWMLGSREETRRGELFRGRMMFHTLTITEYCTISYHSVQTRTPR